MKNKVITAEELGILLALNANKLPFDSLTDLENIETEMKCMHYAQMNGIIDNNLIVYYSGDQCYVQLYSCKSFLIGLGLPRENSNYLYIRNFYVPKELRRMNIGTNQFFSLLNQAKQRGCESIQVEATKKSLGFWKSLGFVMLDENILRMIYEL